MKNMLLLYYPNRAHSVRYLFTASRFLLRVNNIGWHRFFLEIRSHFCNLSFDRIPDEDVPRFKNHDLPIFLNNSMKDEIGSSASHFSLTRKKKVNLIALIKNFSTSCNNISSLEELQKDASNDLPFNKSIQEEIQLQKKTLNDIEEEMINEILSNNEDYLSDFIVEVSAGVGGQEAMLFANQLHNLYCNYFQFRGWMYELANLDETELGGIRHSMIMVSGVHSFKYSVIEAGIHRVQRIPSTEKGSRLHTSTVSIAVYPQPTEVDVVISPNDLKFETKTARGPGGQHVNKIQSAVRLFHLPSGIIVECQVYRQQSQNYKLALQKLRAKLFQIECNKRDSDVNNIRKFQMGMRGRNEKIRTYNFTQDRITDHRFHISCYNVERYLEGGTYFHNFLEQLVEAQDRKRKDEFLKAIQTSTSLNRATCVKK